MILITFQVTCGDCFSMQISTFRIHEIKTETFMNIFRHGSIHLDLRNTYWKFEQFRYYFE